MSTLQTDPLLPPGQTAAPPASAAASSPQIDLAQLLAPFDAGIPPARVTVKYRLGLFCTAVAMLLVVSAYVGLIGLLAYGLLSLLVGKGIGLWTWLLLPVGLIMLLFMLKPLFVPQGDAHGTQSLNPDYQPVLFHFIHRLCLCVGAPMPSRIDVNVDVNASAGFRHGVWSMFSNDLVLTIGLPVVAGLNLRQFAGVLAHEFGHFSQSTAMRLDYIVRSLNLWLLRVVYERDAWDDKLHIWMKHSEGLAPVVGGVLLLFGWLTRRILWVFMWLGHMLTCFMSRQMEFDADRYHARIAGSDCVAATHLKLHTLGVAWQGAHVDLQNAWRDGRLGDDLPALLMANIDELLAKPNALAEISKAVFDQETGVFDTHPSSRERAASAQREDAPGIFHLMLPATVLFHGFADICREATFHYYRQVLGPRVNRQNLIETAALVQQQSELSAAHRTLYRYFQGKLLGSRQLFLPCDWVPAPSSPQETIGLLRSSRERMLANFDQTSEVLERFEAAELRRRMAVIARCLKMANVPFHARELELTEATHFGINHSHQQAILAREEALEQLGGFILNAENRLIAALNLLHYPAVAAQLQDEDTLSRARKYVSALDDLRASWPLVLDVRENYAGMGLLLEKLQGNEENRSFILEVVRLSRELAGQLTQIRGNLSQLAYPFAHARGLISIADYALVEVPHPEAVVDIYSAADDVLDNLMALYFRLMAHLASIAEKVEQVCGLPALPDPPEEEKK